jgi:hypothetical protein
MRNPLARCGSLAPHFILSFRPAGVDLDVSDPARVSPKQGENVLARGERMARRAIASRPRRPVVRICKGRLYLQREPHVQARPYEALQHQ